MGQILEKILYYDLYGYAVPGCTLLLTIISRKWIITSGTKLNSLPDIPLYILIVFLVVGTLTGMVVTEVGEWLYDRLFDPVSPAKLLKETRLDILRIDKALKESGVLQGDYSLAVEELSDYMWYMYSVVQVDPKYARIHNYAASQLLYRNMSVVCAASGLLAWFTYGGIPGGGFLPGMADILLAFVFFARERKFTKKKNAYTVFWFVEKVRSADAKRLNEKSLE